MFIGVLIMFFSSCRKDFDTIPSTGQLEFSKDSVLLNRVFDSISSSTQNFKVYNRSDDDITIPRISLGRGEASFYRLNVDGIPGKSFENIDILAHDSIYVFVEATVDFEQVTDKDFFYRDSVVFYSDIREQDVKLEALVMDVHLIRPDRQQQPDGSFLYEAIVLGSDKDGNPIGVKGSLLSGNTTCTNDKPYLVYGYIGVPTGATLTINAGATFYFHNNSGIIVQNGASIKVNGQLEQNVLFEDDRLEPDYEDVGGQWGTIWLMAGSKENVIDHAIIKNNIIGVLVDSTGSNAPTLTISNTQVYNTSNYAILAREAIISGKNLVTGSSGAATIACWGGSYEFTHCTFANYWVGNFRDGIDLRNYLTYFEEDGTEVVIPKELLAATFTNCIIDGNNGVELNFDFVKEKPYKYHFKNCMLRFETSNNNLINSPLYDFTNTSLFENNILNGEADFKDIENNEFIIGQDSDAINKADAAGALLVPFDILGINRTASPDIGAYQHVIFEEGN